MKTKQIPKAVVAHCLAGAIMLSGCVFNVDRISQQKTGQISSIGLTGASIDLSGYSDNIAVSGTSDSIVKVTSTVSEMAISGSSESALDDLSIFIAKNGTTGTVAYSYPAGSDKWELIRTEGMTLICCESLDVSAKTTSGNITLTGVKGGLSLKTTSGNVTADVVSGCDISVTSGNIEVTLKPDSSFISATLNTTSGNIKVFVPAGFQADLDLKTKSGDIHTPEEDHSHLNGGNAAIVISCTATSGNIRIEEYGAN
jgi:DUF4097 and DUF4098 domain-containing protein YvlB